MALGSQGGVNHEELVIDIERTQFFDILMRGLRVQFGVKHVNSIIDFFRTRFEVHEKVLLY